MGSIAAFASRRALLLILLLALGLRLINLGGRSLWYDEAFAVLFSEKGLDAMLYGTLTPVEGGAADIHPLLYYLTLNGWMALFGQTAFAVRLWSVLLGVATVGFMYRLGRELFGVNTGLAASLITAVAPFHIQYSQETRMYALTGLVLMMATWCFVRAWRSRVNALRWWIAFGVLSGLAMYIQQLSAFYLVALALVPLLARRRAQFIGVFVGATVAIIVYLPWLVNLPGQFSKVRSYYWLTPPALARPLLTLRSFLVVNLDFPAPASVIGFLGALFIILFLSVQIVLYLRRRRQADRKPILFTVWLSTSPLVLIWLVSQVQPVYLERALLPSALILYLLLGWLFTRSGLPRPIIGVIGFVGLILVCVGVYYHYSWATFPNSPFDDAVAYIEDSWRPGDVVVHQNKLTALPSIFYNHTLSQRYLADIPGSTEDTLALPTQEALRLLADSCIQSASRDGERVWFIVFADAEQQYQEANRPEYRETMEWLNTNYMLAEQQHFNDLNVYLFDSRAVERSTECA